MAETETKEAHKKTKILVDVQVAADLSGMLWHRQYKSEEEHAKELERAVKDFEIFLRDHRSQDMVRLSVERIYADLCSACGDRWETYEEDGVEYCAICGAEVVELVEEQK